MFLCFSFYNFYRFCIKFKWFFNALKRSLKRKVVGVTPLCASALYPTTASASPPSTTSPSLPTRSRSCSRCSATF